MGETNVSHASEEESFRPEKISDSRVGVEATNTG